MIKISSTVLIDCGQQNGRVSSRSVSWNSTGAYLAQASSDKLAHIWTVETTTSGPGGGGTAREVLVVSGHNAAVNKARFHPTEASCLCTAAMDASVRLWDVRAAAQRAMGKIELLSGKAPVSVEWCRGGATILEITEQDGTVLIYDTRKLQGNNTTRTNAVHTFAMKPYTVETCIFGPGGKHLIAGADIGNEGMSELRVWDWEKPQDNWTISSAWSYVAHSGPIYSMALSPDEKRLATGGSDAIVGLWDTANMCCSHTITRRTKYIRSTGFSFDSKLLAVATEEDGIDVSDAHSGASVGLLGLGPRPRAGGAEEVAWHPKEYLLACARKEPIGGLPSAPVTIAKLTISSSQ